ncbi:MAG TPA: zf-HC2 domain-containing protein, partial [Blastocatellia bacterium]|nr:zf-HC2 domain-containing protein [Blastocatellia bacterium]
MFRKTEDGAIDNLLRAHVGRAGGPPPICREFDPDLANAYIEQGLPAGARARYEQHLSLCASCRKSVVWLARMAESDTVFTTSDGKSRAVSLSPEPRWKTLLGAMSRPQWAMAAAAVIILVISVPLFISQRGAGINQSSVRPDLAQPSTSGGAPAEYKAEQAEAASQLVEGGVQPGPAQQVANAQQERTAPKPARSAEDSGEAVGPTASDASGGAVAKSEPPQTQPVEAKAADPNADEVASKDASQVPVPPAADAPAPEQVARENQLAKIDPDKAKSVPEQDKEKAEVSVLQPGRPDGESRAKRDTVVRPDEIAPPH